jgi:hypothetical protein
LNVGQPNEDEGEKRNFFSQRPDMVAKLDARWKSWNATLAQPVWKSARTSPEMENLSDDGEAFHVEY